MKNLFDAAEVGEVKARLDGLGPGSERLWGTMSAPQALAHCAIGFEMAAGELLPPRVMIGRILGPIIKPLALKDDAPMRKNSPTVEGMVILDEPDLEVERERLLGLIDRFAARGSAGCTSHPHAFFGRLTGDQWAILMYKHMDHHLRQFGA
ncbi:MAG: DUF1569 domain-containing protein [Granulicella sp.]